VRTGSVSYRGSTVFIFKSSLLLLTYKVEQTIYELPTLQILGNLIQGPRVSSAQPERTKNRSSGMGSADSRIRVSVGLRTPLWSERMSDIDALSIQMDAYDDIVEGKAHGCFSNPLRLCNLTYTLLD